MAKIDSKIKSKIVSEKQRFAANLVYTANWLQNEFTNNLKPFGISPQQYNILRILKDTSEWLAMSELKDGLLEKAPNATRLTDKLLSKELIQRNRSEIDRRVVYVRITEKGLKLFNDINHKDSSIQDALDNHITIEEAKTVSKILDKFRG